MTLAEGDAFGRYVIKSPLGSGGMGDVYRATDTRLHRDVALKLLHRGGAEGLDALLAEARAAAAIDHPNAVSIFDVGEVDGRAYLAMELIEGKTLRSYVGDESIPQATKLAWLSAIARALGAAHAKGIVHRDVKPDNVMIREDGVVKVLDFGIARVGMSDVQRGAETRTLESLQVAKGKSDATVRTAAGKVVGTPAYMAPEQLRGERVDGRADQWAWGVVAYELLTGRRPWDGDVAEVVSLVLGTERVARSTRFRALLPAIQRTVERALERKPAERFTDIGALAQDLERRPPSRAARRLRLLVPSLAVAACAASAYVVHAHRRAPAAIATPPATRPSSALEPYASRPPAAYAAYRAALQAIRDASIDAAIASFAKATAIDPTFAAAHLRRAITEINGTDPVEAFSQAVRYRDSLSPGDAKLLDAFEPMFRVNPDVKQALERVEELTKEEDDADHWYWLMRLRLIAGATEESISASQQLLDRDPSFVDALRWRGRAFISMNRVDDARRELEACVRASPSGTSCLKLLVGFYENEGECALAEELDRRLIASDPSNPEWYVKLADAVYAQRHGIEAARTALERSFALRSGQDRFIAEARDGARLAELEGRFDVAEGLFQRWRAAVDGEPDEEPHFQAMVGTAALLTEAGRPHEAGKLAELFVRQRAGWRREPFDEDRSMYAYGILYQSGMLGRDELVRRRTKWLRAAEGDPFSVGGGGWVAYFAEYADTPALAREALNALPQYEPLPNAFERPAVLDWTIGRTYLAADAVERAFPYLRRATKSCSTVTMPIAHTRAFFDLARLFERTGRTHEACASYTHVRCHWLDSGRIALARQTREAMSRLACPAMQCGE